MDEIQGMSREQLRKVVKKAIEIEALRYLTNEKLNHKKVAHISHKKLELQDYLKPTNMSVDEPKFMFLARTRMLDIKANFKQKYENQDCIACKDEQETQEHFLKCNVLNDQNSVIQDIPVYEDLFGDILDKKILVSKLLYTSFIKRKSF